MRPLLAVVVLALLLLAMGAIYRRVRTRAVGPGAMGAVYDLLNQDRRKAVEIIVEDRAEERDSEHADGSPDA